MSHAHHGHTDIPEGDISFRQHLRHGLPAALSLIAFALLEITVGGYIHNPVVIADGGHNVTDAATVGLCLLLAFVLSSASPSRRQHLKKLETFIAIAICVSTIGLVGWLAVRQILHQPGHPGHLLEAAVIGSMSFGLNRLLAWWLQRSNDTLLCSIATHLYSDSLISLGIVVASGLTALIAIPWWNVLAAIVVLGFVAHDCRHVIVDAWAHR